DEIYSYSVDKLNWTDEYILAGAKSLSTKKYSYMIIDRETGEKEGYEYEKEFKKGKEEKGIDVEVKNKKYFDWYQALLEKSRSAFNRTCSIRFSLKSDLNYFAILVG